MEKQPYVPNAPPPYPVDEVPPPGHYVPPPPGAAPATSVIVVQNAMFGPYPCQMTCPKCSAQITTTIKPTTGVLTWLIAGGLCLIGCWLGCCLIPFCVDSCQDTEHFCPNCKAHLGTHKRL